MKDVYDLTNPQKNILQLEQVNTKNNSINNVLSVMKLQGNLDPHLLKKTIQVILEKNDSFHIRFKNNGSSYVQYFSSYREDCIEIKHYSSDDVSALISQYQNLEMSLDYLYSFSLVFTPHFSYVFYKSHHIIADGWGMTQVAEQIKDIYTKLSNGESLSSYTKPSYLSLIEREKKYLSSSKYQIDHDFWENYVSQLTNSKLFHNDDIFQKKAKRYITSIPTLLSKQIDLFCQENHISEYSFFLAVLSIYFLKIYNKNSMVFGTPFLNRQKRNHELECTGLFVCTLPLLITLEDDSFLTLCQKINSTNLSIFKHSNFPYHEIETLYHKQSDNMDSLYEVGFSYQINEVHSKLPNGDQGECTWYFAGEQNNPLTVHLTVLNHEKLLSYDYLTSCFSEEMLQEMNQILLYLIEQILTGKDAVSSLSAIYPEALSAFSSFCESGTIVDCKETVISRFEKIVTSHSDHIAVVCGNQQITYQELYQRVSVVTHHLLSSKLPKGSPIVLFFDKSIDMIVSMLAVLKAGGCYVPILPDENSDRVHYIIEDCQPFCILTHGNYREKFDLPYPIFEVDQLDYTSPVSSLVDIDPSDIAYIIYTSGSTGNPKGTMVMHRNICGLMQSISYDPVLKASDRDVSISLLKYSFDASGIDIYTSLLFGGKLILVQKEDELNPEVVLSLMEKYHVSRSFLIPKWIEHIAMQDHSGNFDLSDLRILGTGGEALKPYLIKNLLEKYPNLRILNLYGPTETTMFTTCKVVSQYEVSQNHTTIGRPIYGARLGVINAQLEFLPPEVEGELVVYEDDTSLHHIAKGYLHLPEQTQKRFIQIYHPILKKMVNAYRTGDIVKLTKNLEIEFIGRDDDVVKVNGGYLVALNEVEKKIQNLLGHHFEVYPIAVPFKNTKIIVLFLTKTEKNISMYQIKNYINNNISFYMKPKKIIELDAFPRNSSGKIDRKKLKQIALAYLEDSSHQIILPKTKTEKELYKIIKKFVNLDTISVTDDFIDDLGIDSLSLTSIYTSLEKYHINIQDIYNNPTIKDLANYLDHNDSFAELKPNLSNLSNIHITNQVRPFSLNTVLLTGVTGFLGIHLLRDLLYDSSIKKVYCIIRNKINLNGKKRLDKMIGFYFPFDTKLSSLISQKVIILNGDITKEFFGLEKKTYEKLRSEVTTVINSAANVRHFVKPAQIRKDNVQSVNYMIDFCGSTISLAHISTLSIAGFKGALTKDITFDENVLYIDQEFNENPYLISKFEAEKNILYATNYGNLNAVIFRMGNIMPRYSDGVFQQNATQNVFLLAMKSILDCHMVPIEFLSTSIEFSPVDECSKMILSLLNQPCSRSIYHILNPNEITIAQLVDLLKVLHYDIKEVDLATFENEIVHHSDEYTREYLLSQNLNSYSLDLTLNDLSDLGLSWQCTDSYYLEKILAIINSFDTKGS